MKWFRSQRKANGGFTLLEVAVGMVIISAAAVSMFYGITYARASIRQIAIKERALEELVGYLDYYRAIVSDHTPLDFEWAGDLQRGTDVILYNPTGSNNPSEYIVGTIYRERMRKEYSDENPNHDPYFMIEAFIVWEDHIGSGTGVEMDTLRMQVGAFTF